MSEPKLYTRKQIIRKLSRLRKQVDDKRRNPCTGPQFLALIHESIAYDKAIAAFPPEPPNRAEGK